jgi:hypothetical protein
MRKAIVVIVLVLGFAGTAFATDCMTVANTYAYRDKEQIGRMESMRVTNNLGSFVEIVDDLLSKGEMIDVAKGQRVEMLKLSSVVDVRGGYHSVTYIRISGKGEYWISGIDIECQ